MASVITSIQKVSIAMASGDTSKTATISSVTTTNTILIFNGLTTDSIAAPNDESQATARVELTDATTVTAYKGVAGQSVTINCTVVEFASGVNSIQAGTIVVAASTTSNTATISSVGSNAFVLYLGETSDTNIAGYTPGHGGLELTNSTTVTAYALSAGRALTMGYMVVDLDSTIISSVQKRSVTNATSSTSYTDTISSVNTSYTLLFYNGFMYTVAIAKASAAHRIALTNSTTVTLNRNSGSDSNSRTIYYTAVEFQSAILNSAVQRGNITGTAVSRTATITTVNTALAALNYGGFSASTNSDSTTVPRLDLTNATTVTSTLNSSGPHNSNWEVIEFAPTVVPSQGSNVMMMGI